MSNILKIVNTATGVFGLAYLLCQGNERRKSSISHFPRNRYSSKVFVSALSAAEFSHHHDEKIFVKLLVGEDEIEV